MTYYFKRRISYIYIDNFEREDIIIIDFKDVYGLLGISM